MNTPFFSFDGVDGAGKTTQIDLFNSWLRAQGRDVVVCRDPGTTPLGEQLRRILLESDERMGARAEMLLYMAARSQLVEEFIRPALNAGKIVVSDRFLLANVVYQGHAGGIDVQQMWQVGAVATDNVRPTLTFVLDVDPALAASRRNRAPDRMERRGLEYQQRVRQGFLTEAAQRPAEIVVLDASRPPDQVQAEVRAAAESFL